MEIVVNIWTGYIKRWKKKLFVLLENGFKIIDKKNNSNVNDNKSKNVFFSLTNGTITEREKDNVIVLETPKSKHLIQFNSKEQKNFYVNKIKQIINNLNYKNAFSKDFNDYSREIHKIQNKSSSIDILNYNITYLYNCFREVTNKLSELKDLIEDSKFSKEKKSNFLDIYTKIFCIEEKMKTKYDQLVQGIFDFRDFYSQKTNIIPPNSRKTSIIVDNKSFNIIETDNNNINNIDIKKNNNNNIELLNNENNNDNNIKINTLIFPDESYNFEPRKKISTNFELSKNMISKIIKAYTSGQKTLPIQFNEPISMLQKECEKFHYSYLLNLAADQNTLELSMCYISAFIIGEMSLNIGRILKPMTPLIGETYEFIDNNLKIKYFSEEVQRKPHISAFYCESEKWLMFGDNRNSSSFKFLNGSYEMNFNSKLHIKFKNKKIEFVYNRPTMIYKGILTNNLHYDFNGKVVINTPNSEDIECVLNFKSEKKDTPLGTFDGEIINKNEIVYKIFGNWNKNINLTISDEKGNNVQKILEISEQKFFLNSFEKYELPEFTINLNYLHEKLKKFLPKSDSRLRPDQREYEKGNNNLAQEIKDKIEKKQIDRQDYYDNNGINFVPYYFKNEYDNNSEDFVFKYQGGYWEDRNNNKLNEKIKDDIFNVDNY